MNKFKLLICLLLISSGLRAQTRQIQGTVVSSDDGQPLIGVTVLIEGTTQGTSSNADGSWQLAVPDNGSPVKLSFSYIGYETQVHTVAAGQTMLNVRLSASSLELEEVVAIGYGVMRKSDVTGAVASITPEQLQKTPAAGLDQALQGRAAGVTINASSGQPGASAEVRIRGIGTVNDSSPIYVVDGVITDDISFVNPQDIASTEILKDASATAIYGSRGANGVIIVTTKSGKAGSKINIDFNAYVGIQNRWNKLDLMGRDEFAQTIINLEGTQSQIDYFNKNGFNSWLSAYRLGSSSYFPVVKSSSNPNGLDYSSIDTDWQDVVFKRNAVIQNYHISASGGSGQIDLRPERQLLHAGRYDHRIGFRTPHPPLEHLLPADQVAEGRREHLLFELAGPQRHEQQLEPRSIDPFGRPGHGPVGPGTLPRRQREQLGRGPQRPHIGLVELQERDQSLSMVEHTHPLDKNERWVGNVYLDIEPLKGLRLHSEVSMDLTNTMSRTFMDQYEYSSYDKNEKNFISRSMSRAQTMRYENTLTYMHDWGKHSLTAMVGQTTEEYNYYYIGGSGASIANPTENNWYLNQATEDRTEAGDSAARTRMFSMLGRLHYSYDNRYLITFNFRADASSKFPENLWGYFPSTAVAWRINEEPWLRNSDILNNLKLRLGWGQIGNDKISDNAFLQTIFNSGPTFVGYPFGINPEIAAGATVLTYVNTGGKWETTEQWDLGVDFGLWNNKLTGTVDLFLRDTKDMLLSVTAPAHVGNLHAPTANVGTVRNQGIEITLGHANRIGEFDYEINGNVSFIRNRLTALNGGERVYGDYTICDEGLPLYSFWGYEYEGIYSTDEEAVAHQFGVDPVAITEHAGDARYKDQNGDGIIDDNDLVAIGNPFPWLTYGLNLGASWRGLDLTVFFQGVYGNEIYNAVRLRTEGKGTEATLSTTMRNVWSKSNPNGSIPNPYGSSRNTVSSSRYVEDGSYLRLKELTLGYTLPKRWTDRMHMNRWRFYVSVSNLFTLTGYTGYDPEVGGELITATIPSRGRSSSAPTSTSKTDYDETNLAYHHAFRSSGSGIVYRLADREGTRNDRTRRLLHQRGDGDPDRQCRLRAAGLGVQQHLFLRVVHR